MQFVIFHFLSNRYMRIVMIGLVCFNEVNLTNSFVARNNRFDIGKRHIDDIIDWIKGRESIEMHLEWGNALSDLLQSDNSGSKLLIGPRLLISQGQVWWYKLVMGIISLSVGVRYILNFFGWKYRYSAIHGYPS
ncbi:hypothetical protein D3C73_1169240 [compost metagenome]